MLDVDRADIAQEQSRAAVEVARIRRAMLADMPSEAILEAFERRNLIACVSTETLRRALQERGYYVEPPRGWPRMGDDE